MCIGKLSLLKIIDHNEGPHSQRRNGNTHAESLAGVGGWVMEDAAKQEDHSEAASLGLREHEVHQRQWEYTPESSLAMERWLLQDRSEESWVALAGRI